MVEGTIVNAKTGTGIGDVAVAIEADGKTAYSTTTDALGHFLIEAVKEGSYWFRYSKQEYWPIDVDLEQPMRPLMLGRSQTFQVTTGGNSINLKGQMLRLPIFKVRVVDGNGKGVRGAQIDLSGPGMELITNTDAEGNSYRLESLLPGAYTLSVVPPPSLRPPDHDMDSDVILRWTRTWYPGVRRPELASKIVLRPGGEDINIELRLLVVPGYEVRGVVLNPSGNPVPSATISLGETNPGLPLLIAQSKFDGTFEFPSVPDGCWVLLAYVQSGLVELKATQWIDITGSANDVKLRLAAPFTVQGKVVTVRPDGTQATKAPMVFLSPHQSSQILHNPMALRAAPDAEGNFELQGVYPGVYRIHVQGQPPGPFYLDSIRVGEVDATMAEVELASGAVPITLVYRVNGGTLRGAVESCTSGSVALVPQNPALRQPAFLRWAGCDAGGHYDFAAVRPGEYYVVAFAGTSPLSLNAVLEGGPLDQAGRVNVRAGENSQLDLKATVLPE
jgi:hypothetical protein